MIMPPVHNAWAHICKHLEGDVYIFNLHFSSCRAFNVRRLCQVSSLNCKLFLTCKPDYIHYCFVRSIIRVKTPNKNLLKVFKYVHFVFLCETFSCPDSSALHKQTYNCSAEHTETAYLHNCLNSHKIQVLQHPNKIKIIYAFMDTKIIPLFNVMMWNAI